MQIGEYSILFSYYLGEVIASGSDAYYSGREPPAFSTGSIVVPDPAPGAWALGLRVLGNALRAGSIELWTLVRECPPWLWMLVVVVAVVTVWSWWRSRLAEQRALARACWLEITAPAQAPGEGVEALPRALAGLLAAMPTLSATWRVAPRVAVEMIAGGETSRMGVWLLGGWDASRVVAAITQALPGARVSTTSTPDWRFAGSVRGRELRPWAGPWTVLVAPTVRRTSSASVESGHESLRAVFSALAHSPVPAALQLVIAPATGHGPRVNHADGLGAERLWTRCATALLVQGMGRILLWALYTVMSVFSEASSSSTRTKQQFGKPARRGRTTLGHKAGFSNGPGVGHRARDDRAADPVLAAWDREMVVKQSTRPLLHATLRVATLITSSPNNASSSAVQLAGEVAIGYALALPRAQIQPIRAWRFDRDLRGRRPGRGFYATLAELGALWHLPAEPAHYRLPEPAARNRPARPDVPRLPTTHT